MIIFQLFTYINGHICYFIILDLFTFIIYLTSYIILCPSLSNKLCNKKDLKSISNPEKSQSFSMESRSMLKLKKNYKNLIQSLMTLTFSIGAEWKFWSNPPETFHSSPKTQAPSLQMQIWYMQVWPWHIRCRACPTLACLWSASSSWELKNRKKSYYPSAKPSK